MKFFSRPWIVWGCLVLIGTVAIVASVMSPLWAWRQPVYIIASIAGVFALVLLLFQPLLMLRKMPGLRISQGRKFHRWVGISLVSCIVIHVLGLWITSPPDVIDALLFRSPTQFTPWGVVAMWAVFLSAGVVAVRRRLTSNLITWQRLHRSLGFIIVLGSVVHAFLIEGTMETWSKALLCLAVIIATIITLIPARLKSFLFR